MRLGHDVVERGGQASGAAGREPPAGIAVLSARLPPVLGPGLSGPDTLLWESSYGGMSDAAPLPPEPLHAGGFVAGTRIATAGGEGLIEALRIGDLVVTRSGMRRQVKWIGQRAYSAAMLDAWPHLRPVLFEAGSLGNGLPRAAMRLAPTHGVVIDQPGGAVLVPAAALVNGRSIRRAAEAGPVAYVHVELNSHDVLIAEGTGAESYVEAGNRGMFHNAADFAALYPGAAAGDGRASLRRLEEGEALAAIRSDLADLAGVRFRAVAASDLRFALERRRGVLEGWAVDAAAPDVPVMLDVMLDGSLLARLPANRYRPDLDRAGIAGGRAGFTCPLPARGGHIAIRLAPPPLDLAVAAD